MRRRFFVAVQGLSRDEEAAFTDYIRESRLGWWHWIEGFWLVTTKKSEVTVQSLRNKIAEINSDARILVMEIPEDVTWAGRRGGAKKNMFDWLKTTWTDE